MLNDGGAVGLGVEAQGGQRQARAVDDIGAEIADSVHASVGALAERQHALGKAAARNPDGAVDPDRARRPIISQALAARKYRPAAGRGADIGIDHPGGAAAWEVDERQPAGGVERLALLLIACDMRPAIGADRRALCRGERPGDACDHRRGEAGAGRVVRPAMTSVPALAPSRYLPVTRVRSAAIWPIRDFCAARLISPRAFSGSPTNVIMPLSAAKPLSPAVSTCELIRAGRRTPKGLAEAAVDLEPWLDTEKRLAGHLNWRR